MSKLLFINTFLVLNLNKNSLVLFYKCFPDLVININNTKF